MIISIYLYKDSLNGSVLSSNADKYKMQKRITNYEI